MWLDVVKKECLEQVGPVDFEVDLFEESAHIKSGITDLLLGQLVSVFNFVKLKGLDGRVRESECLKWAEPIVRLIDVIYDHQGISKIAIGLN